MNRPDSIRATDSQRPLFCQFCGHNELTPRIEESAFKCAACNRFTYLNSKPSACAIITRDEEVLLVTDGHSSPPTWDLPGGFLLHGEAPEDGLRRELREELCADVLVGHIVAAIVDTYANYTDFSLNLFYDVELISNALSPGPEIQAYGWFAINDLPSITHKSTLLILSDFERLLRKGPQ